MTNPSYFMPPEWAPHEATWLTWPKDPITWPDRVEATREAFLQMMEALSPHEKINLLVDDEESKRDVQNRLKKRKVLLHHIYFYLIPTVDSWIRDYGPIFVKKIFPSSRPSPSPSTSLKASRGEGERKGDIVMLDFIFNAWGNKYEPLKTDDPIPQKIRNYIQLPLVEPGIVLEGGSIDVNGKGSLLTTEQCLLNKNRNPHLSKIEIENYLKRYLGAHHILWLGEGIEGDDTDGHVDDVTRFVSEDTIVTVLEEDREDPNFKPLQDNLKRLQGMKDQDGKAFKIVSLPMPGRIERNDGEGRLPASYANFYIANQVVLVPIYRHKKDEEALEILQKLFPSRKVIGIISNDLIWGMGGIHCVTQQQPK